MALPNTPTETPTTLEIKQFIIDFYKTELGIAEVPEKGIVSTMAGAFAAIYIILFRLATWSFRQIFIGTADPYWVKQRGLELGIEEKVGKKAIMECSVSGVTVSQIDQGVIYTYNDLVYTNTANATITSGEATIYLEAPYIGTDYEIEASEILELVRPIVGLPPTCAVLSISTEGVDPEDDDDYYTRVDTRIKLQPQGGSAADYFAWTTEVEGINDCYVYLTDLDDNDIYPIAEGDGAGRIPTAQQLSDVEDSINKDPDSAFQDRRPTTANAIVSAVSNEDYDISILGFGTGRPQSLKDSIETELKRYFEQRRASNPALAKEGNITLVNVNAIVTIINTLTTAEGFSITGIVLTIDGVEITIERPIPQYYIASLGTVTYVD